MAYDRLLTRLYRADRGWIVKGATALLARDIGVRGTLDIDMYREVAQDVAENDLRRAAARDIGDWFRFEVGLGRSVATGAFGVRLPVSAFIGMTQWVAFHVDLLGADLRMTGSPDDVSPLARVTMPGFEQLHYRVYPLVDHVADKIVATLQRYGSTDAPSTRYKDLVDLVAIIGSSSIDAVAQLGAVRSEAARRAVTLPVCFDVPDHALWPPGYARAAAESLLLGAHSLEDALGVVRPFIDPLLGGGAVGRWNPQRRRWTT